VARDKITLPASYGGLLRYGETVAQVQVEPGHVILLTLLTSALILLLHLLK